MSIVSTDPNLTTINKELSSTSTRLRPRRTLNRLALALVGVMSGVLGQVFFSQESLWDGLLFYGVAIILFNWALAGRLYPSAQVSSLNSQVSNSLALQEGWRSKVGVWLIVLAVGLSGLAFNFFAIEDALRQAWWLYIVSLALLVSGGVVLTKSGSWRMVLQNLLPNNYIVLGLAVVMGLALFMRLYNLGSQPFGIWYDEAEAGLQARRMLQEPTYRPIFLPFPINHPIYLPGAYALALAWLGDTIYSMRLVSVLFGLGGVLAAYLFGRELRGPRFGLALAFLMAVARWHVNFSRIAMTGVDTPFFEFLSLFFLIRMVRGGRLRDALWAGLTLGVGLMVYTGFRLYVAALLLFVIIMVLRWPQGLVVTWRGGGWRAQLAHLAMILIAVWLVITPLVRFALDNPRTFWYRTRQISVFTKRDQPDLGRALWNSTHKHLLMFNFKGDKNGRHNLPGEPMLDPAMGILAVLGFGLALARLRAPANTFFLLLFPITLTGGILSVDFEAPQSLRSIAVMPVVIYFPGLALAALGREAEEALKPLPRLWLIGPAAALAGFMLLYNASTYFGRQARDFASWNAFSTPETITGRKMAELGPNYIYYLSPFLTGHPTLDFLVPDITKPRPLLVPNVLPIHEPPEHPVALFIHPDDLWIFQEAQRFYPNAEFGIGASPDQDGVEGQPAVYFVNLQPADLAALQGLQLSYKRGNLVDQSGRPSESEQDGDDLLQTTRALSISATWPADSPVETNFVAEWRGILYAPQYGPYTFRLLTPGPGRLELDGNLVLDGQGEQLAGLALAEGHHNIRVQVQSAPGEVALFWQPPGQDEASIPQWALYTSPITNHGLEGTFYANDRWAGQPVLKRIDAFLDTYFHLLPLNRPYTVEWTGMLDVPQSGLYLLGLRAVAEAHLFLDGQLLITTAGPDQYTNAPITLEAGLHDIRVRFKDNSDRSRIHLFWTTPGGQFGPIPSENLWPPLGRYPEKPSTITEVQVSPLRLDWVTTLGGPGVNAGQFLEPRDVAVQSNGHLVVADTANRRVQIFDGQGNPRQILGGDPFPFEEPLAVAVNSRDEILILDSTLQWVYRYDAAGNFIDRFGGPTAYLFHPRGMTVLEDDTVVLADTGTSRLAFFNADGSQAGRIGELGSGPGQFNEPIDVLRDAQGTYFVTEAMNNRLQRLDPGGNSLGQWTIPPAYAFNGPHLAFGPDGSLFMTESQSHSLLRYAPDGSLLDQWQTIGPIELVAPVGVYFDATTGRLYLTDVQTHQIHIFEVQEE